MKTITVFAVFCFVGAHVGAEESDMSSMGGLVLSGGVSQHSRKGTGVSGDIYAQVFMFNGSLELNQ